MNGTVCADAIHPSLGKAVHLAVHNHYGTQHALDFIRQQESSSSDRLLYLNQASSLGNSGKAGSSGDDLSADWISMKIALVQVDAYTTSHRKRFFEINLAMLTSHLNYYRLIDWMVQCWTLSRIPPFICFQLHE